MLKGYRVLYGTENVIDKVLQIFSQIMSRIDTCVDHTRPALAIQIKSIRMAILDAKSRELSLRYLTEITNANVSYCKELMSIVSELRQQYVFETLWNKSIAADKRIREIEYGITIHYGTKIIQDPAEVVKEISRLMVNSNELYTCLTSGGMQYSYNHFFEIKKKLLEMHRRGEHKGVKYVSDIQKENAELAKVFLDSGIEIRHIKNLPPVAFEVSDKEIAATIEKMEGDNMVQTVLLSNEPAYIKHFRSIFEELWTKG